MLLPAISRTSFLLRKTLAMNFGSELKARWPLDPGCTYLNHGTVGVTPYAVLDAQQAIRMEIECQPAKFMDVDLRPRLRQAADRVAQVLGGAGDDYVFIENASTGINAVLRGLDFEDGDEILYVSHAYGAVKKAIGYVASRTGAIPVAIEIPYPPKSDEEILTSLKAALSGNSKLAVLDHITSETALRLPIRRMIALCRAAGVPVLVDGAHAPAMSEIDIPTLGAAWYAGNLHKWMFAPRGCGFLWTDPGYQKTTHPLTISWGYQESYIEEFAWTGTHDFSRYLAVPAAVDFMQELGESRMRLHNDALVREGASFVADAFGLAYKVPDNMTGAMTLIPLLEGFGGNADEASALRAILRDEHNIELHIIALDDRIWGRVAAQVYNDMSDFEKLTDALETVSARNESLIS
jgi:isopenicillin-N epimerase